MLNTLKIVSNIKFNFGKDDIEFKDIFIKNSINKIEINFLFSCYGPILNIKSPVLCHFYQVYDINNNLVADSQFPIIANLNNETDVLFKENELYKVQAYYIYDNALYIYESDYTKCVDTNISIKNTDTNVSILIAVNNRVRFLNRTIASVILNNINNYEIILVNNAKDEKANQEIFDCVNFYNKKYNNIIKYFDIGKQTDKTLHAKALNKCITESSGRYCMFIDADDIISNNNIKTSYEFAISNNLDMVTTGHVVYNNESLYNAGRGFNINDNNKYIYNVNNYNDFCDYYDKAYHISRWNKLIKRKILINNLVPYLNFKDFYEDVSHIGVLLSNCNTIGFIPNEYYIWDKCVRDTDGSVSTEYKLDSYDLNKFANDSLLYILNNGNQNRINTLLLLMKATYFPTKDQWQPIYENKYKRRVLINTLNKLKSLNISIDDICHTRNIESVGEILRDFNNYLDSLNENELANYTNEVNDRLFCKNIRNDSKKYLNLYYIESRYKKGFCYYAINDPYSFKKCKIYDQNNNLVYEYRQGVFLTDALDNNSEYYIELYDWNGEIFSYSDVKIHEVKDTHKGDNYNLTVIIPCYNCEKYIDRLLLTLLLEHNFFTEFNLNILLVDDCSTDSTVDIIKDYQKSFSNISLIQNEVNIGRNKTRKVGIDNSKTELITFADNDDYITFNYYHKLYKYMTEHKDIDVMFGSFEMVNDEVVNCYTPFDIKYANNSKNMDIVSSMEYLEFDKYHWLKDIFLWNKIFKKDLFKNYVYAIPSYDIDHLGHEDTANTNAVMAHVKKFGYIVNSSRYVHVSYTRPNRDQYTGLWHNWDIITTCHLCMALKSPLDRLDENIYGFCRFLWKTNHNGHPSLLGIYSFYLNKLNESYNILNNKYILENKELYDFTKLVLDMKKDESIFKELDIPYDKQRMDLYLNDFMKGD